LATLTASQLRSIHKAAREAAILKTRSPEISVAQVGSLESNSFKGGCSQIARAEVGVGEINADEIAPAQSGFGQVGVAE
jgi:hypothetical protein